MCTLPDLLPTIKKKDTNDRFIDDKLTRDQTTTAAMQNKAIFSRLCRGR
jgi:hypothetical protein